MKYSENRRFSYDGKSLNKYLYKLVTFVGSEDDEGKKDVDIVLSKWIRFSEEENKYFTRFPSPPYDTWTMKELNKLLKNCISAPSIWMEYEIEIENHAKTFPEAQKLFGELKSEMKRKYSKKNFDKTRKSTRNSEIFNIENLFNSMNDSLLPYVLIEKLDCVASSCGTPKKNSAKGINDNQVSPMLSTPTNTRRTRSKLRQTIDQNSIPKKLDTDNLILNEKRGLRKRKSNDSLIEYYFDSPSKKSYKSPRNKKGVNFSSLKSDLNGNENSVENYEVTVNLTMLRQQEIEQANCYNSYNSQDEDSEITVVQVHRSYSQEQEEEEELMNSIDSTRQFELPTCNSNENQNTSQIEDTENDENAPFEKSEVTIVKESYSQMQEVESNSVDSIQQYELSTSNSKENENTSQMKITDNAENEQLEKSQMTAIKVPYSQMEGEESNSVDSTQKSGVSTCNSNNSENTTQSENTDNDENIFSEVITEKEKENSCLLFLRILKALNIIHLNQLDVQRTLRDVMNLTKNNDLESTFFKKFNFILPITTVDENLTMNNNNNDLQQAFFAKFNLIKPISTVDEFILFDDELKLNSTFRENFTQMLKFFIDNDNTLLQCVNKVLNECIAEEVRAQYNATTITESSSRIFRDTEFYKILLDSITKDFQKRSIEVTEDEILQHLETIFGNSFN